MWARKAGYCEDCLHHRPKINNCIDCYVEKLTKRSREFMINGNEVDSRKAIKLANYLQQLGISFHSKTKEHATQ